MQYNQTGRGQVRVGNWFEELKLKEDTGIRFYPEPSKKESSLLTKTRCIEHSARLNPKEYISVTNETLRDPKLHPSRAISDSKGPRFRKFESTVKQEIEEKVQRQTILDFNESRRVDYESEAKSTFRKNGFRASLQETNGARIPTKSSNYSTENAVTFYSFAVEKSPNDVAFPMSFVKSVNPFRKNCVFSADIATEVIAARTETFERPQSLPTVREYKTLLSFRARILEHTRNFLESKSGYRPYFGQAIRFLIDIFARHQDEEETPLNDIEADLYDCLGNYQLTPGERYALISAYDKHAKGSIPIFDLAVLFKRTPIARRMELIGYYYNLLDIDNIGSISLQNIVARLSRNDHAQAFVDYFTEGAGECTIDDFFDFYVYVSSEVESEEEFESILQDAWGSIEVV